MKETFAVLNQMVADGAIENYALAGAVKRFAAVDVLVYKTFLMAARVEGRSRTVL
jgi:hypothetical protein